jgi:amidohydrolase
MVDPLEPAVITIGAIHGGTAHNVIPDDVTMLGTVRTFNETLRDALPQKIESLLEGCCESSGATYDFAYQRRYPITINDPAQAAYLRELAINTVGAHSVAEMPAIMGAEDFSFFLQKRPGCFFFLGAQPGPNAAPHHSARFAIDEAAFENGVKMMVALACDATKV